MEKIRTPLSVMIVVGILAAMIGALLWIDYLEHIDGIRKPAAGTIGYLLAKGGVLLAESLICLAFAVWALALPALAQGRSVSGWVTAMATLRLLLLVIVYAGYWKKWYYILDPAGSHKAAFLLLVVDVAQCAALVWALVRANKGGQEAKTL